MAAVKYLLVATIVGMLAWILYVYNALCQVTVGCRPLW